MKERVKTSAILLLLVNMIMLTCRLWLGAGFWQDDIRELIMKLPFAHSFADEAYSMPREMLSTPRKILINDGSLWIAYYNTDAVFYPIEARTRQIIEGFLRGETHESRKITAKEWQKALEAVSVYVEYPIAYTTDMLCSVMGIESAAAPKDVASIRDFVIIPSREDSGVFILVRDAYDEENAYIYRFDKDEYSFPQEDMAIYTENNSGYYEPAFSTGVEPEGAKLDPMVLFSDSRPETAVIQPVNPLETQENKLKVLDGFFYNVNTAGSYDDKDGVIVYIENYSNARIYPNGLFEYKSVSEGKGVKIADSYDSYYETINAAIRFAENLWSAVSDEPLSVLVTSDLTGDNSETIHLTLDYYYEGRPVAISLAEGSRFNQLNHGIEMDISQGQIVEYRQLFRKYHSEESSPLEQDFISALDSFANTFAPRSGAVIKDIYIGYMDRGEAGSLKACWLAETEGEDITYSYEPKEREVLDE